MLVQALKEIQDRCGYLPHDEMHSLSKRTGLPLHRIHEVASYYPLYKLEPPKGASIKVCRDMACHIHGAPEITQGLENLSRELGPGKIEVCGVSCLGQCDATVAALINDHHVYRGMDLKSLSELARKAAAKEELPHQ
ncbi:MAG: NAD(P)H-dependent oxidoreductase subunit E, partial [Gemmataceae bacterium]|nr:NAD(P)H-dependent oxidoreductase subunit E [Gemmataceae bacterium]